jgi:hypothetical protein
VKNSRKRILARALQITGSREALAQRLNVDPAQLDMWLSGRVPVPERVLLGAVDIILPEGQTEPLDSPRRKPDQPRP